MPEAVTVECGFCHKHFRCPPELRDRPVRCPFCKTATKIPASSEAGRQAVDAMSELVAAEKADRQKVPLTARHRVAPPPRGVRSRELVTVWLVVIGLGLIAGGVGIYWRCRSGPPAETNSASAAKADSRNLAATKPEQRPASAPAPAAKKDVASAAAPAPGPPPEAGNRNPAATESEKGSASAEDAAADAEASAPASEAKEAAAPAAAPAPEPPSEGVTLKVERLLGGFRDDTITYAVGRVKNNTKGTLKVLKVSVRIADKNDKELGEATQVLLNLPAGATAPLVAEWQHAEGVIGRRWMPSCELNPMGVPQDLPPVSARDAVAIPDTNTSATRGWIKVRVVNHGALSLPQVQFYAILTAPDGKIVGAAKATIDQTLPRNSPREVTFPWVNCRGNAVQGVEVWVQAGL